MIPSSPKHVHESISKYQEGRIQGSRRGSAKTVHLHHVFHLCGVGGSPKRGGGSRRGRIFTPNNPPPPTPLPSLLAPALYMSRGDRNNRSNGFLMITFLTILKRISHKVCTLMFNRQNLILFLTVLLFPVVYINLVERYLNAYFPVTSLLLSRRYQAPLPSRSKLLSCHYKYWVPFPGLLLVISTSPRAHLCYF